MWSQVLLGANKGLLKNWRKLLVYFLFLYWVVGWYLGKNRLRQWKIRIMSKWVQLYVGSIKPTHLETKSEKEEIESQW